MRSSDLSKTCDESRLNSLSSEELAIRARDKLPDYEIAWSILVKRHHKEVCILLDFCFQIQFQTIQDIVQETWINLYRRIQTFKGNNFKAWFITSAKREALRYLSKTPKQNFFSIEEGSFVAEPSKNKDQTVEALTPHENLELSEVKSKTAAENGNKAINRVSRIAAWIYTSSLPENIKENIDKLIDCVKKLPPKSRELFVYIMEGYQGITIAEIFGIPVGTIKSRKNKLIRLLSKCLKSKFTLAN